MTPLSVSELQPTAQPREALGKATAERSAVAPELWAFQCAPPSDVVRMVPQSPTVQP